MGSVREQQITSLVTLVRITRSEDVVRLRHAQEAV